MFLATTPCRSVFRNTISCAPIACRSSSAYRWRRRKGARGARFLPIESNSIDLVLLPHILEFSANPHQILREVQRVLVPEGHAIVCGFNPRSLWGVRGLFGSVKDEDYPWQGNFIARPRLKDWLTLLDFEITEDRLCCYAPPSVRRNG